MKHFFIALSAALVLAGGVTSCKGKDKQKVETTTDYTPQETTTNPPVNQAPVTIAADDSLQQKLPEITKDFPGVTATANNGEVTLTGTVTRDRLPRLMESVHAMNPRKVNNQLTIK